VAEGEHLSEQTRHLWLADKSKPYEGTAKNPQGRLFAPTGSYTGDPMKLHPANWLKQSDTPAHSDTIGWHSSHMSSLPRSDDYEDRAYSDEDLYEDWSGQDDDDEYFDSKPEWAEDSKERPMGGYGSVVGMHLGNLKAAGERDERERDFIHPARIPESTMAPPPKGSFATPRKGGSIAGGDYRSNNVILNAETGEKTPDTRWSDSAANFAEKATDLVESGKTIAYRNDVEGKGSTSFRTLPETVKTWSEDVTSAVSPRTGALASKYGWKEDGNFRNEPHPGLVHLAEKGYDPVVMNVGTEGPPSYQLSLPFGTRNHEDKLADALGVPEQTYDEAARVSGAMDFNKAQRSRTEEFEAGHTWQMRKPTS
jgi:hypothetical protein